MARFVSKHVRNEKSTSVRKKEPPAMPVGWTTLEELRTIVMLHGCTKAQFAQAVETVGDNPHHVANYLQRYEFSQALASKPTGG